MPHLKRDVSVEDTSLPYITNILLITTWVEELLRYQQLPSGNEIASGERIKIETARNTLSVHVLTIPIRRTPPALINTRGLAARVLTDAPSSH